MATSSCPARPACWRTGKDEAGQRAVGAKRPALPAEIAPATLACNARMKARPFLNEDELSAQTVAVLERVGAALGAREGTGPADDLQMRTDLRQALAKAIRHILTIRGIEVSEEFPANAPSFAKASEEALINAALACDSEANFRMRIREQRP